MSRFNMIRHIDVDTTKTCAVVGGGPSLCDFDYSALDGFYTIGTNKSFKYFVSDILYCMDLALYDYIYGSSAKLMKEDMGIRGLWEAYPNLKVFPRPLKRFAFNPDIRVVYRIPQKRVVTTLQDGIYPGNNVGFGALMLAIALGFKTIHLYGIDMTVDGDRTHFHEGYHNTDVDQQLRFFEHYKKLFNEFAPKIKEAGVSVINMNPNSALECFEKRRVSNSASEDQLQSVA